MENILHHKRESKAVISRMARGLVACAECKRMKLKCDKKVPCGSCVRRECSSICPTGILFSRQASRAVLAGDSGRETQDDLARLREVNLKLEDALASAHSYMSKDIHPLLAESPPRGRSQGDPEVDKVTEVLGTLTVGEAGELKYLGPSSFVEPWHQAAGTMDEPPLSTTDSLSTQTPLRSTVSMESFVSTVLNDLPGRMRAWSLCETFYKNYIYNMPIQENELMESYLCPMYKYRDDSRTNEDFPLPSATFRPHRCAVMFFIFAIGAWFDLTQEHYWMEADRYFQIGLSCFSMQSIFYSPEVASVQALFLLAYYTEMRGAASTSTLSPGWTILSLACKISQGLGLHRDPSHWSLDDMTVYRRRLLYWELTTMEFFHCLGTGRPPTGRSSYVDTELPEDVVQTDTHGQSMKGFIRWKHEAVRECYLDVVETLQAATPVKYEVILELDRKIRAKEIPAHLNRIIVNAEDEPSLTAPEFMHTCILGLFRSLGLLSLHRRHLTEALQDSSGNPLKSRYAPSFLASYRAASWIIKSYHAGQTRFPVVFGRLWHPWTAVLTAAMVLGSIAIRVPSSFVGNSPLEELRVASSMFEKAAPQTVSYRTKNGAKLVQKILARAEEAQALHSVAGAGVVHPSIFIPPVNYGDDELAIFGGKDRLLPTNPRQAPLRSPDSPSSQDSDSFVFSPELLLDAHPSLIEFLNTAPVTQVARPTTFQEIQESTWRQLSPFRDPVFMPAQLDSWATGPLPTSHKQDHLVNAGGPSPSGLQNLDTFENYLTPPSHVDHGVQPTVVTPWQDFMMQHSLT
ncbi:fungal-specific transcription factor domain-containing protein [Flagelloscypha sp. PMI_526]|nr:fungal-specific transcription factor domain-containing protein [Flagelloscypha sp. PMI_526]